MGADNSHFQRCEVQDVAETRDTPTILCLASYEKGQDFVREAKRQGWRTILVTVTELEGGKWPHESIDEIYYMPALSRVEDVILGVSYLARTRRIERIVPLDDYDVETAAALREHFRLPGQNASAARRFRDKLAMRTTASQAGILVPDFVPAVNDAALAEFVARVPPPWVLKPRAEVSSIGIARVDSADQLWSRLDELGDRRSFHVLERFVAGEVYHVDSIIWNGQVLFAEAHRYGRPPMEVFHEGGIAMSRTLPRQADDVQTLLALNQDVVRALGMERGVTHAEFIKGAADGRFYFLEIGARVGGGNTAELVEAATGINLWAEWARIETSPDSYELPAHRDYYAGVILSLARQERPDTSAYMDEEIVSRLDKRHHVGFVLASPQQQRIEELLNEYSRRIYRDFFTSLPPWTSRPPT